MLDGYQELKQEMIADAQQAWQTIKDLVSRYGKYGALVLGLMPEGKISSISANSEVLKDYASQLEKSEQKLTEKLTIKENSLKEDIKTPLRPENRIYMDWNNVSAKPEWIKETKESVEQEAKNIYKDMTSGQVVPHVTIEDLMSQCGVSKSDMQAVIKENPEMLHDFIGGDINKKLAEAASDIKDPTVGKCTRGVQNTFCGAGMGEMVDANNPNWPAKERGANGSNSACNLYIPLEKSGKFVTVTIENEAYKRGAGYSITSEQNKKMNDFIRKLPTGTTICIDNKADEFIGRKMPTNNQGWIHGHTGVINKRHNLACDFEQVNGVNFGRYGPEVKISLAKDMTVNEDFITKCLVKKKEREQRTSQIEQSKVASNFSR